MTLNTPNKTGTLRIHGHTNKIRTELHQDLTETTVPTRRIMEEEDPNIWLSASLHPDKERRLHADIAEDARFAAQDLTKTRKDVAPTANASSKSVYSHQFLPKPKPSFPLMLSILACEIWVLAQTVVLVR
jgi:hypothetical protein